MDTLKSKVTAKYRYFKVCPRGFANEVTYYRVPVDKAQECEQEHINLSDNNPNAYCGWTTDKSAYQYGVAIAWADRHCW